MFGKNLYVSYVKHWSKGISQLVNT